MATLPTIRLGLKLILLTMVRKSELQDATWDEVDFENAVWSIPKERMKRSKAHNVYLSRAGARHHDRAEDLRRQFAYLLPSRYDADAPMSRATFNRVTTAVVERAKKEGLPLEPFTVHDLRRTGSTLLNELGFNSDWIEKCLAHEDGRSSRGVYNKAEYEHAASPHDAGVVEHDRCLGRGPEVRPTLLSGRRCSCLSPSRLFDRARLRCLTSGIGARLMAFAREAGAELEPGFDLGQIPDDAARREIEAPRKLAALFHLVDRAVGERHHLAQLLPADRAPNRVRLDVWKSGKPVLGVPPSLSGIG